MDIQGNDKQLDQLVTHVDSLSAACRRFSTLELCLAWQQSFVLTRQATDPRRRLHLTRLREAFLDELERRDQDALHAWLHSDAMPAASPLRFFGPRLLESGP